MPTELVPSDPVLQGEYLILATDYYSYALAWQCDDLPLKVARTGKYYNSHNEDC